MENYFADMHTHTIASGHAYSTIKEMAEAAQEKGIKLLGITEHSKNMPGSCHDIYFANKMLDRVKQAEEKDFNGPLEKMWMK